MLRESHSTEENEEREENREAHEARSNRQRLIALPLPPVATAAIPKVSPKTSQADGITERAKQRAKPQKSSPMRYSENKSGKSPLWRELITDNPMYQKETLSGRRSLELQTPLKRFWKRFLPLLFLGAIYLSIYVFIISVYNNAYEEFMNRFMPNGYYYKNNYFNNNNGDWLKNSYGTAENYAKYVSSGASTGGYSLLLILQFFVVAIGIPATAITKITAERERMNWDSLLMSRLSPLQVLAGKVVPVLKAIGRTTLALLPAILITAYMSVNPQRSVDNLTLRGVILAQVCLVMTALMNVAIGMYFSLTEKQSAKAAVKTGQWFAIPTLGVGAVTGILYTLVYLVQMGSKTPYPQVPDWLHPLLWLPNIINPILAIVETMIPANNFRHGVVMRFDTWAYYLAWLLLPFLYPLGCAVVIRKLGKKMMQKFQDAPKDASG